MGRIFVLNAERSWTQRRHLLSITASAPSVVRFWSRIPFSVKTAEGRFPVSHPLRLTHRTLRQRQLCRTCGHPLLAAEPRLKPKSLADHPVSRQTNDSGPSTRRKDAGRVQTTAMPHINTLTAASEFGEIDLGELAISGPVDVGGAVTKVFSPVSGIFHVMTLQFGNGRLIKIELYLNSDEDMTVYKEDGKIDENRGGHSYKVKKIWLKVIP